MTYLSCYAILVTVKQQTGSKQMQNTFSVLPLGKWIRGKSIQQLQKPVAKFFSGDMGGVLISLRPAGTWGDDAKKQCVIFTSGSAKRMVATYFSDTTGLFELQHDQTFKDIGYFSVFGWFQITDGTLGDRNSNISLDTRVDKTFTFK